MVFCPKIFAKFGCKLVKNNNTIHIIIHLYVFLDFPPSIYYFRIANWPDGYYFVFFRLN